MKMDYSTYLALKQMRVKKPIIGWKVVSGGITMYQTKEVQLAWHYIRIHSLKLTPVPYYN